MMDALGASDESGRSSRTGFYYQDLCALRYLVRSLRDNLWSEVWCEARDDIALKGQTDNTVRLLQVKWQRAPSHVWTCATVCTLPPQNGILGKLFYREIDGMACDFRLLVNEGVDGDLKQFHYYFGHAEPTIDTSSAGAVELLSRLEPLEPPDGLEWDSYLRRFAIEEHSTRPDELERMIWDELRAWLHGEGLDLLGDELDELFTAACDKVAIAARADKRGTYLPERIRLDDFRSYAHRKAVAVQHHVSAVAQAPSRALVEELERCGVSREDGEEHASQLWRTFELDLRRSVGTERGTRLRKLLDEVRAVSLTVKVKTHIAEEGAAGALAATLEALTAHQWAAAGLGADATTAASHGALYYLMARGFRLSRD